MQSSAAGGNFYSGRRTFYSELCTLYPVLRTVYDIELANRQRRHKIDRRQLTSGARAVLAGEGISVATLSLAVVDNEEMQTLNARHLRHDYPTDVLSFLLERSADSLEGEVIVSADYAAASAPNFGWSAAEELLLYVIHGTLHLCGHDDQSDAGRAAMRERETHYLAQLGVRRAAPATLPPEPGGHP